MATVGDFKATATGSLNDFAARAGEGLAAEATETAEDPALADWDKRLEKAPV